MLCPRGHATTSEGKKLRLFSRYDCDVCHEKVSQRGGVYHKCAAGCDFRVCGFCKKEAERTNYFVEPCTFAFPGGLGPFNVQRTRLQAEDLAAGRGAWTLRSSFFRRAPSLQRCWEALLQNGVTDGQGVTVHLSPLAPVKLSSEVRQANSIPDVPGVMVAWMYALQLEWHMILSEADGHQNDATAELSFLKIGGLVYFRPEGRSVQAVCANSIFFHPSGCMQFSAPQPWCSEWTAKLAEARRFHQVTAVKWAGSGARYVCWICPEEKLLHPGARHGGFAFIFHELDEEDMAGRDRFFEVVGAPVSSEARTQQLLSKLPAVHRPPEILQSALPFRAVGELPATTRHVAASQQRCFRAASDGRWALLAHILSEFPQLATVVDDEGALTCQILLCQGVPQNAQKGGYGPS